MTSWLIIRTDSRKELAVLDRLEAKGIDAWCPMEFRIKRKASSRVRVLTSVAAIPGYLFAAFPLYSIAEIEDIDDVFEVLRDGDRVPVTLPASRLDSFRLALGIESMSRKLEFERSKAHYDANGEKAARNARKAKNRRSKRLRQRSVAPEIRAEIEALTTAKGRQAA